MTVDVKNLGLSVLMVLVLAAGGGASQGKKGGGDIPMFIAQADIQADIMDFSDQVISIISQATDSFEETTGSVRLKLAGGRAKVETIASAIAIASGPYPGVALLDMVVFTTLNAMVWEKDLNPRVYDNKADKIVAAFKTLEKKIWGMAAGVLSAKQLKELRELIKEWHAKNPNIQDVSFIRFSDFGELGHKPGLKAATKPGGLLGPLKEAALAAEDIKKTAERAMYLVSRMQLLAGFQLDLILQEFVLQPPVQALLSTPEQLRAVSDDLTRTLNRLPDKLKVNLDHAVADLAKRLGEERKAAINQALAGFAAEREAIFDAIGDRSDGVRPTIADLRQLVDDSRQLADQVNILLASYGKLSAKPAADSRESGTQPADAQQIRDVLDSASRAVENANALIKSMDRMLGSSDWDQRIPQLISAVERSRSVGQGLANHVFILAVALVLIYFFTKFIYAVVTRRADGPKCNPE